MAKNLSSEKAEIRKNILPIRNNLSKSEVNEKSEIITNKVLALSEIKSANNFLVYVSFNKEVETEEIIKYLIQHKKRVFIPAFYNNEWLLSRFKSFEDLEKGSYQVLQPREIEPVSVFEIDLAIIPGVAFDKNGVRLGFGKGVYDRLLKTFRGTKIGLAFNFQIINSIPKEKHDLIMDFVVTDKSIFDFRAI